MLRPLLAALALVMLTSAAAQAGSNAIYLAFNPTELTITPSAAMRQTSRSSATHSTLGIIGYHPLAGLHLEADFAQFTTHGHLSQIARAGSFGSFSLVERGRLASFSTGINLVQDLVLAGDLRPYLLAGISAAQLIETRGPGEAVTQLDERLVLDLQLGAGLAYRLGDRVSVAAGYRYLANIGTLTGFEDSGRIDRSRESSSHLFGISFRIPFGPIE